MGPRTLLAVAAKCKLVCVIFFFLCHTRTDFGAAAEIISSGTELARNCSGIPERSIDWGHRDLIDAENLTGTDKICKCSENGFGQGQKFTTGEISEWIEVDMSPQTFLSLASPMGTGPCEEGPQLKLVERIMQVKIPKYIHLEVWPAQLKNMDINAGWTNLYRVISQNGRHRAWVFGERGCDVVRVRIVSHYPNAASKILPGARIYGLDENIKNIGVLGDDGKVQILGRDQSQSRVVEDENGISAGNNNLDQHIYRDDEL